MDLVPASPTMQPASSDPDSGEDAKAPEPDESRRLLVQEWTKKIRSARDVHWKDVFKAMREGMSFLGGAQWGTREQSKGKYVANIVQRFVQQRTSALYAKNPTFKAKRRKTRDFKVWDGTPESLKMLQQKLSPQAVAPGVVIPPQPDPASLALFNDIAQGLQKRQLYDNIAETMEIVMNYFTNEDQTPPFKRQMKQLVRRVCACGVGYVKIGYQRSMEMKPENVEKVTDTTEKLALIQRLIDDAADGDSMSDQKAEVDELKNLLTDLKSQEIITSEGLTFDFPAASNIIVDPKCRHLTSFLGARWVVEQFVLDVEDIEEIYKVDISKKSFTAYKRPDDPYPTKTDPELGKGRKCCVWEVWDKHGQQVFTLAEGYNDFLREPAPPDVKIKRFWPFFPLSFNEIEDDENIFPQSDVELLMPMQREFNRARESLREHRIANIPRTMSPKGSLDDEDLNKLQNQTPHCHIQIGAIAQGQKISEIIQAWPTVPIDQALYDTAMYRDDAQQVGGQSDASLGTAESGVTATGDSIAEQNRSSFNGSVIDEMDDMLGEMALAAGQILLSEVSQQKVIEIAGIGAVWPVQTAQQISDDLILTVEAGSSGRPNKAAEIDNFNKLVPMLLQIPGISPEWLAKEGIRRLDDSIDPEDAVLSGVPSMLAMSQQAGSANTQPATGDPASDPSAQGGEGAANTPGGAPQPPVNPGAHNMAPGTPLSAQ